MDSELHTGTGGASADRDVELFAELCRLYEYKDLLWRAQRRGANPSFASETYAALLAAFNLRAENFQHAARLLERAINRGVWEALIEIEGLRVGDEVLVHRGRAGRLRSIQHGLLYVAHDDGRRPPNSNHLSPDNVIRLEAARRHHRHGLYTRAVREFRPFRMYEVVKPYAEMEEIEFLSALPVMPHVCPPCGEDMRAAYDRLKMARG